MHERVQLGTLGHLVRRPALPGEGKWKSEGFVREKSFSRCKRGGRGIEKEWKGGERERQEERARRRERETNFLSIMSSNFPLESKVKASVQDGRDWRYICIGHFLSYWILELCTVDSYLHTCIYILKIFRRSVWVGRLLIIPLPTLVDCLIFRELLYWSLSSLNVLNTSSEQKTCRYVTIHVVNDARQYGQDVICS